MSIPSLAPCAIQASSTDVVHLIVLAKKMNKQIFWYLPGLHWYILLPGSSHSSTLQHWQRLIFSSYSNFICCQSDWNRRITTLTHSSPVWQSLASLRSAGGDWLTHIFPSGLGSLSTTNPYTQHDCCWYQLSYILAALHTSCTRWTAACTPKNTEETTCPLLLRPKRCKQKSPLYTEAT